MKLLLAAMTVLCALQAQAQDEVPERDRIRTERSDANVRFTDAQRECRGKFAVNDCMAKARREHNAIIGDLKRQENVLNDGERRRRSAERQEAVDERNSPEQQQKAEQRRLNALKDQQEREQRAAEKAGKRAADEAERAHKGPKAPQEARSGPPQPQGKARAPAAPKATSPGAEEAAKNKRQYEERVRQAEKHRQEVQLRVAKRSKPPASALPVPAH